MAIEREECCQKASVKTLTCTYHVRAVYRGTRGMCPIPLHIIPVLIITVLHGARHGFKIGGGGRPKPLLNLKVSRSLILIYKFIKLSKILIHAFKY